MHSPPRRTIVTALAAALASLTTAGAAHAVTLGSDLTRTPDIPFGASSVTVTQALQPSGAPFPLVAPADGVVTRIRQKYAATGADPGSFAFRILSGANPYSARPATVDGIELRFPLASRAPEGIVDFLPVDPLGRPTGIPIRAGERLAVAYERTPAGAAVSFMATRSAPGAAFEFASGTQHLSGEAPYTSNGSRLELLLQATVEPDADGDLLGDETQDQCPGLKNDPATRRCPSLTREVPVARCKVPLLRGLTRRFAARLLVASGCKLGAVRTRVVRRGRRGRVIGQGARANAVLAAGARIGITLSRRAPARRRG